MKYFFENELSDTILRQSQLIQTRLAGRAVTRVVERCENATESNILNLSKCQLCQLPDAVYHLMRNTTLVACDLSDNCLSKLSTKFSLKFSFITELNLSHNRISNLPDEFADCAELQELDISHNAIVNFPKVIFKLPKIKIVAANNNYIMDANECSLPKDSLLEEVNLMDNPLTEASYNFLITISEVNIKLSPREANEWDDL